MKSNAQGPAIVMAMKKWFYSKCLQTEDCFMSGSTIFAAITSAISGY